MTKEILKSIIVLVLVIIVCFSLVYLTMNIVG